MKQLTLRYCVMFLLAYMFGGICYGQTTIWSEDWGTAQTGNTPSTVNPACYKQTGSGTKVYTTQISAGGESPELLISKNGGSWTVTLESAEGFVGKHTLSYLTNKTSLKITANGEEVKMENASTATNRYTCKGEFTPEGNATTLVIVFTNSSSSNVRIDNIVLTGPDASKTATTLTFPQASYDIDGTTFDAPQATLTDVDGKSIEGATIVYAISGDDIATINESTGAVTLKEDGFGTAKVTATYAGNATYSAASATYTLSRLKKVACSNIAAIKAVETGTLVEVTLNNAQVVYANATDCYVRDESGAIMFYNLGLGLTANQIINGKLIATYTLYKNLPELTKHDATSVTGLTITNGTEALPTTISMADAVAGKYNCDLVTIAGGNVSVADSKYYIGEGTDKAQLYDKFRTSYSNPFANARIDVTGIMVPFDDIMEICPVSADAITYNFDEDKENSIGAASNVKVALKRTLDSGHWNTFCVPFGLTTEQIAETLGEGTQITVFAGTVDGTTMNFTATTSIEPGTPCLVKPGKTTANPIFNGVTMVAENPGTVTSGNGYAFSGTYSPTVMATDGTQLFVAADGSLKKPATDGNTLKGMRAYITIPAGTDANLARISFGGTTAIDGIETEKSGNETVYNLKGQRMGTGKSGLAKGLYIMNGKKMIIK